MKQTRANSEIGAELQPKKGLRNEEPGNSLCSNPDFCHSLSECVFAPLEPYEWGNGVESTNAGGSKRGVEERRGGGWRGLTYFCHPVEGI